MMKKIGRKGIPLILCAVLTMACLPLPASAEAFSDVPENAWYAPAVEYVQANGLMNGNGDGTFTPNKPMTRAMFVQVLYNMTEHPEKDPKGGYIPTGNWYDFSDVDPWLWYCDAIRWAYRSGIADGVGNNRFEPERAITREQMAKLLYRYAEATGNDTSTPGMDLSMGYLGTYPDWRDTSSSALNAMCWAKSQGILQGGGNGMLRPRDTATRAEAAQVLMKAAPLLQKRTVKPFSRASGEAEKWGLTAENYPRVDCSTSTLNLVQDAYWQMHDSWNEPAYPVEAARTVPAYEKLIAGDTDLILVPYASADVLGQAEAAGVELEFHKLALEALVFVTRIENSTENITEEQVASIYRDYAIRNWKELGGPDEALAPFCRNGNSGSHSQMDNFILHGQPIHPEIQENYFEDTMMGILGQVYMYGSWDYEKSEHAGFALGYTMYAYFRNAYPEDSKEVKLKLLSYNGIAPTEKSLNDGSYPLTDGYYAVLRKDTPRDAPARKLLSWYQSAEGERAIRNRGFLPAA